MTSQPEESGGLEPDGVKPQQAVGVGLPEEACSEPDTELCSQDLDAGEKLKGEPIAQPQPLSPLEPGSMLGIAALVEGGLVLLGGLVGWLIGEPVWKKIHWNLSDALLGAILPVPLLAGLWLGLTYPRGPWRGLVRVLMDFVVPLFARCRVWQLALISILAGLGEEIVFRGLLQDGLTQWLPHSWALGGRPGLWLAVALASTVFGLLHWISPFYALLAGLIGAYLGWWRIQSGNLLGPIIAHALYDFAALLYLTRWWRPR